MTTTTAMRDALHVRGLDAYYGASHVIHDLDLRVAPGELVTLLGRNGAGKTTTFAALMGLVSTPTGSVEVHGDELAGRSTYQRARSGLSLIPSGARVFANLTVEENLQVVRSARRGGEDAWDVGRVYEVFPKLDQLRASFAGNLSGGERQMLAVGRGLMANPRVLLFDEPSEGLAPVIVQEIGRLLGRLKDLGLSMILAEQNHRFALRYADRAYLIEKGQIRHEATSAELATSDALSRYLGV
ncbi:ABC transporter ATP-binding protein [Nitriliruptor alkaliphilus]|uniref:ABC transporter ATP-binding protein n=1 Tax=Nitriliruptor alkaliphilus TaxID=427918 RepID=UPI000A8A1762|nr:ABC transporter ATP-binding protein [Nitriliruptor alkaliphilus]